MGTAELFAPTGYRATPSRELAQICNGCGPNSWKGIFIPDTIYGLKISEACDIHDWMYHKGLDEADRADADQAFVNNIHRLIEAAAGPRWLRWLRRRRSLKYYGAVRKFGSAYFWRDKNRKSEIIHARITTGRGLA